MVGRELVVGCQRFGLHDAGLGARQFGVVVADRVQPRLHQLGDAAIRIADARIDTFELGARLHELGGSEAQLGKFALKDEVSGAVFVAAQTGNLLGLLLTGRH